MNKSALVAFFLAFIPGWGHLYLGKKLRFVLYGAGFWFLLILGLAAGFFIYDDWPFIILMLLALVVWAINMLDMHNYLKRDKTNVYLQLCFLSSPVLVIFNLA